jgi:hypothetical protein
LIGLALALADCGGSDTTATPGPSGGADGSAGASGTTGGAGGTIGGGGGADGAADAADAQAETGVSNASLGSACTATSECDVALKLECQLSTGSMIAGGGPAHGICTKKCDQPNDCAGVGGLCLPMSTNNKWCVEGCTLGGAVASKCHGRLDQACWGLQNGGGGCFPQCASDADCGARTCDPVSGMCVDGRPSLTPIGTPCDDTSLNPSDACATTGQICVLGSCTVPCRYGGFDGCGYRRTPVDASPGTVGACVAPLDPNKGDTGDVGICWQLCDVAADCLVPDAVCDMTGRADWGHGFCFASSGDAGPPPIDAATKDAAAETAAPTDAAETAAPTDAAETDAASD